MVDDTDTMPEGHIDSLVRLIKGDPLPESILCGGVHYIPAPTWRPIAELPEAWRDGRWVVVSIMWSPSVCLFRDGLWRFLDGRYIDPTHYLDLTIPEVPR